MKKNIYIGIVTIFLSINTFITTIITPNTNDETGRTKIINIMFNAQTGTIDSNYSTSYAETHNLGEDLNIPAIVDFFGCKTLLGKTFLTQAIKFPLNSQDKNCLVANRQNNIRLLLENPDLKKEIENLLEVIRENEKEVIALMSDYFIGKTCSELDNLALARKQTPFIVPLLRFAIFNPTMRMTTMVSSCGSLLGIFAGMCFYSHQTYQSVQNGYGDHYLHVGKTAYFGLLSAIVSYNLYRDYSSAREKQSKLFYLRQLITNAEKIEQLSLRYGIKTQSRISNITSTEGKYLLRKLKSSRYKKNNPLFFMTPLVHTFLYKIYHNQNHLAEIFACIGEIDAYNAIATKILESYDNNNKFCFAHFLNQAKPLIRAQSFWNVLVKDPVTNSINENRQIILTGPNAGGKSTAISALLQNILLAQTFGIAAAEHFEITIFDIIHSYLNVSGDISKGLSLFAAEIKRAKEILQKITMLDTKQKFFFALDELFTGTVAEDGEICAYKFIKKIANFNGFLCIYATHFNKLKELEIENPLFVNYKIDAPIQSQGRFIYPYTLSKGASQVNIGLSLAQQAGLFD